METINLFNLKSKCHFSNGYKAYNTVGECDIEDAEYVDIHYDTCTDEYKKIADNQYQLISAN